MQTPHQQEEMSRATSGRLGILTGGPGCGKTYSIADWIKSSGYHGDEIQCMCPTGKAAVRLTQSLKENGLPLEALTIHRALKPHPLENGEWAFSYGDGNRWDGVSLIIGDEWSMVDSWLFGKFLASVPPSCKVILSGDPNQLPPVGHGKPFKDMIDSGVVPHGHLTEPHRFSGRIGQVCKAIQDQTEWEPSPQIDLDADFPENFRHFQCADSLKSQKRLFNVLDILEDQYGMNPVKDVQVLVAVNDYSELSRERLNWHLQRKFNPETKSNSLEGVKYRKGDKVICLRNGLKIMVDPESNEPIGEMYVANGEIGFIHSISKVAVCATFGSSAVVRFPRDWWNDQIALAYAVTVHKSQGSQWPVVITMIDSGSGASHVCNRPWVYTGISRASKISITIGSYSRLMKYLRDPGINRRITGLKEDLLTWKRTSPTTPSLTL